VNDPAPALPQDVAGTSSREDRWARQQVLRLAAVFFLVFVGGGAFQQFLAETLKGATDPRALRTTLLAVTYGSFLLWRIGVAWTEQWLGEWASIALGALCYAFLPFLIVVGAPAWLLIVGATVWGFGAASFWVASGTRVLHLTTQSRYGRGTAAIYVGSLTGIALGLVAQSYLGERWGAGAIPWWAAGASLAGAALAATLWRGSAPQERPTWSAYRGLLLDSHILLAGVMLFASGLTYGVLLSTFSDAVVERSSLGKLGLVALCFHLPKAALSYVGGWASDRWGRNRAMAAGFLAGAGGLLLTGLLVWTPAFSAGGAPLEVAGLALAALFLGIPAGVVPVAGSALVGDRVSGPRRMMGLGSLFIWRDAAVVAGMLGSEYLRRSLNLSGSYLVMALILAGFALASGRLTRLRPEASASRGQSAALKGNLE